MVSTPDEPGTPGEEEAPEPDATASAPPAGYGPGYGQPPAGYGPPPGYGSPGGYGPGYGQPPAGPGAPPQLPAYQRKGAGIAIGLGIGLGLVVVAFLLMMATLNAVDAATVLAIIWPFLVIPALVALLYFAPRWRMVATGVLIMFAGVWLVVLGPCIGLIYGLGSL